jgi:formylglycine-generating enzyme required for sulfatase activity
MKDRPTGELEDGGAAPVFAPAARVGRFVMLEEIGAGAMGVVHAAYDPELDRRVALKFLRPQDDDEQQTRRQERMLREAKAIARLSHPNVVGIFEVGVHQGQVFMAMEYLARGTLGAWLRAGKRPWSDVLRMFVEVGRGLRAAHLEGLVHRDFKPDNVLLDRNGVPKVVDFGLVQLSDGAASPSTGDDAAVGAGDGSTAPPALSPRIALTRTGALLGTPAYMAPEQFLGGPIDAKTDQFAFGVALFEALHGARPFAGTNVLTLAEAVVHGDVDPPPKGSAVPAWIHAAVMRMLRVDPRERFSDFDQVLAALQSDPVVRRRRRLVIGATLVLLAAGGWAVQRSASAKQRAIDQQAAENAGAADAFLGQARAKAAEARALREQAYAAFDSFATERGEKLWASSLAMGRVAEVAYEQSAQRYEAAAALTPRGDVRERIVGTLIDLIQMPERAPAAREEDRKRLALYDTGGAGAQRLDAPATLHLETIPPGLEARIESYDPRTFQVTAPAKPLGRTPLDLSLPAGSYRFTFAETGLGVGFNFPVLLAPGGRETFQLRVPSRSSAPDGFVYVPTGTSLFGFADEEFRTTFLNTVPLHPVQTGAFWIARHETTMGEWIAFLNDIPAPERLRRRPHGTIDVSTGYIIDLQQGADGRWELRFGMFDKLYRARQGEVFNYRDRALRASADWSRFPVSGISPADAEAYVGWLRRTGRVPGARLCTEREWERAARGADGRDFPHGSHLAPDDANFDETYGRKPAAFGPDEVGSHPASRSPFGVDDMVGNVWEITVSSLERNLTVLRGSCFYQARRPGFSANREMVTDSIRDPTIGVRVCADVRE